MRRTNKLVLFLVLAAFLFTAVASASASTIAGDIGKDAVGTKYEKAVSKLAALEILKGYEDGTVKPDNMITRAEFAAIAIQELGLSDQIANAPTQFSDVTASHWASGIVNLAAGKGIVKGFPDGTFRPDEQVTYAQAAAMLVQMLGWGPAVDGQPWPAAVLYRAADLDISKDVTMDASAQANRGDIFIMASNALKSDILDQTQFGDNNDWTKSGETPLNKYFDAEVWKDAVVTAAPNVTKDLKSGQLILQPKDGKSRQLDLAYGNPVDFLGMEVEAWVDVDDKEVLWAYNETDSSDIKFDFITKINTKNDEITLDIADDDYDVDEDAVIYLMNDKKTSSLSKLNDALDGNNLFGTIVLGDNGDVRFIAVAELKYINAGFVTEVKDDSVEYYEGDTDRTFDFDDYDDVFVYDSQLKAIDQDEIAEDAVIYAWENDKDDELYVIVTNEAVEGNLDRVAKDKVKIDGDSYDVADNATASDNENEDIEIYLKGNAVCDEAENLVGEDVIAFLDLAGDVRHIQGASSASSGTLYGLMTDADRDAVTIFNADGKEVTYKVEKRGNALPFYNFFLKSDNEHKYLPVQYKLTKDGEVKEDELSYVNIEKVNIDAKEVAKGKFAIIGGDFELHKNNYIKDGDNYYYVEGSTVLMSYDFDVDEDPELVKWADIKDTDAKDAKVAIIGSEGGKAKLVAFFKNFDQIASDDYYYAIVTDGPDYNGNDYEVELDIVANGDIDSDWYVLSKDNDRHNIAEGDLVRFELNANNKIKTDFVVLNLGNKAYEVKEVDGKTLDFTDASSKRIDGNAVVYTVDKDGDLDTRRAYNNIKKGDVIIYLVDKDNTNLIRAALIVNKYKNAGEKSDEVTAGTITYINVKENLIEVDGEVLELATRVRLLDAKGDTKGIGKDAVVAYLDKLEGKVVLEKIVEKDGLVTEMKLAKAKDEDPKPGEDEKIEVKNVTLNKDAAPIRVFLTGNLTGGSDYDAYKVVVSVATTKLAEANVAADGSFSVQFASDVIGELAGYNWEVLDADGETVDSGTVK